MNQNTEQTETDKFFAKFENDKSVSEDLNNLAGWLSLIGQKYGAKIDFLDTKHQHKPYHRRCRKWLEK